MYMLTNQRTLTKLSHRQPSHKPGLVPWSQYSSELGTVQPVTSHQNAEHSRPLLNSQFMRPNLPHQPNATSNALPPRYRSNYVTSSLSGDLGHHWHDNRPGFTSSVPSDAWSGMQPQISNHLNATANWPWSNSQGHHVLQRPSSAQSGFGPTHSLKTIFGYACLCSVDYFAALQRLTLGAFSSASPFHSTGQTAPPEYFNQPSTSYSTNTFGEPPSIFPGNSAASDCSMGIAPDTRFGTESVRNMVPPEWAHSSSNNQHQQSFAMHRQSVNATPFNSFVPASAAILQQQHHWNVPPNSSYNFIVGPGLQLEVANPSPQHFSDRQMSSGSNFQQTDPLHRPSDPSTVPNSTHLYHLFDPAEPGSQHSLAKHRKHSRNVLHDIHQSALQKIAETTCDL